MSSLSQCGLNLGVLVNMENLKKNPLNHAISLINSSPFQLINDSYSKHKMLSDIKKWHR